MTQINLRIDDEVKRNSENLFNEMGLSMSSAITIFLKTVCREKRIPFEVRADSFSEKENTEIHTNR
jgi:DNA-damage-inducible protein J